MEKQEFIIAPDTVTEIKGYRVLMTKKGYIMWVREDLNP